MTHIEPSLILGGIAVAGGIGIGATLIYLKKIKPKKEEHKVEEIPEEKEEHRAPTKETKEEILRESVKELKQRVEQEKETRKKLEEKYDELRVEYERTKEEAKKKDEQLKETQEKMKKIEEESAKLVKISHKRYRKGQYIPAVLWTERMNALPYKFVVEIAWVNGGYRALLVDSITDDPEVGKWFPPLNMPAPNFCFMDDPGFNPDDPSHTVLFAINRHDWEEDLKVTERDPEVKPVALVFGIDIKGNPVHPLRYGSPIHINTLRSENRNLKYEIMRLRHQLTETRNQVTEMEYKYQMEKDLRQHLEQKVKELEVQLHEAKQALILMGDEITIAREAWETERRRRLSALKRALQSEELFNAYYSRPMISELPDIQYHEKKSKEKKVEIISLLAPIARVEAKQYDIDITGKSDEEIVYEWLRKKKEEDNMTLSDILKEYELDTKVADILLGTPI